VTEARERLEGRLRVRVRGAVQGVGFRPFVYNLATRHGLAGFVLNDAEGVLAEIEGSRHDHFLRELKIKAPPLARIDTIDATPLPPTGEAGFAIRDTQSGAAQTPAIPDATTCRACLDELFDPTSRFHRYPFITCPDCGPRFTLTSRLPFDRAHTSMARFRLCPACASDYADPASRRFHAETMACAACGPRLSQPIEVIADAIAAGRIVALKGIGGFHLICDATDEAAVRTLRARKRRPDKPFAVMMANAAAMGGFAVATPDERALLRHAAAPIVLVRAGAGLAAAVAPGLDRVGIMLAAAPVHHLLFEALSERWRRPTALVMTSANVAGEPLAIDDAAGDALSAIAELIVTHDRAILHRADDSVMQIADGAARFIRRSRGFVPEAIEVEDGPTVLALGGHQKAAVCVARGREAFLSQHIGDLDSADTIRFYTDTIRRLLTTLGVTPDIVACDRHPDYRSTLFAEALERPVARVQHHAAHVAAVAAEHRRLDSLIGVALDGYGYGDDGGAWGGELLLRDGVAWHRCGHLRPLPLPGGNRTAREPWRMGVAALVAIGRGGEAGNRFPAEASAGPLATLVAAHTGETTTSMGRLFDAASALLGVCPRQTYEGQAAMELQALVRTPVALTGGFRLAGHVLDFSPLITALLTPGLRPNEGADLFHGTIIAGLAAWIVGCAEETGHREVMLGGGCLGNVVLAEGLAAALRGYGLTPCLPRLAPANDGGLCLGQAAIARARFAAR